MIVRDVSAAMAAPFLPGATVRMNIPERLFPSGERGKGGCACGASALLPPPAHSLLVHLRRLRLPGGLPYPAVGRIDHLHDFPMKPFQLADLLRPVGLFVVAGQHQAALA